MLVWNDFRHDARVLKEAQTLQAAGYQVVVHAVYAPRKTDRQERLTCGVEVCRSGKVPSSRSLLTQLSARLHWHLAVFSQLLSTRAAVIHAHDINTLPTAWAAAKLSGAKLIYDAHEISTSREGYAGVRRLVAWLERRLMPSANGTITTTDARAKFFARAYHVARPVVLQNRPRLLSVLKTEQIRYRLGLNKSWPIIVYQGGLQQGRGLHRLIRAAMDVPDAYFVFIGSGRLESSLQELVRELKLVERVHFIPMVPLSDLLMYTASADIGVQPIENTCLNHYTTDSNKLFEYVQAGLPVVASDLPEIRKIVRSHELGLLVSPGDDASLANALRVLVNDENKRRYHAERSGEVKSALTWEAQERELVSLYEQVLCAKTVNATGA